MGRYYPNLPAPGLDWLSLLTERLSAEQRAAVLELLDLAAYALGNGTHNHFAEITRADIEAAIARVAGS